MAPSEVTILIDGCYALHRVLKAKGELNPFIFMKSTDGFPTGGAFGYLLTLSKSLATFNVKSVINVWDSGTYSARRVQLFEGYKHRREAQKHTEEGREYYNNFDFQRLIVTEFLSALGIPSIFIKGKEADDIIGFLSRTLSGPVMVLSDDKDYWQLVNDRVCVYRPVKQQFLDPTTFIKVTGIYEPWRYLLYCAIVGDDGDDIPGIKGVGATTAEHVANLVTKADPPSVRAACAQLTMTDKRNKPRYQKIVNNLPIIGRNFKLIDLTREIFTTGDQQSLQTQLSSYHRADDLRVMTALKKYDMQSIASKLGSWMAPFRRLSKVDFIMEKR